MFTSTTQPFIVIQHIMQNTNPLNFGIPWNSKNISVHKEFHLQRVQTYITSMTVKPEIVECFEAIMPISIHFNFPTWKTMNWITFHTLADNFLALCHTGGVLDIAISSCGIFSQQNSSNSKINRKRNHTCNWYYCCQSI